MFRREDRDQIERSISDVCKGVGNAGRHFGHVRPVHDKCLVADPVFDRAFEEYVGLFYVVHVKPRAAAGMRLRNDERERLEPVLVAGQTMRELARDAVVVIQLIEVENECVWVVRNLRRVGKVLVG